MSHTDTPISSQGAAGIEKVPTGIAGFDEITYGGLPLGRSTLVTGNPGAGKTLFAIDFLVNSARSHGAPGVLLSFEESADALIRNAASVSHDLHTLIAQNQLIVKAIATETEQDLETGDFSLDGLFLQLELAIQKIGATRVVVDTPEALFSAFTNQHVLRREIHRLYQWLHQRGITSVTTGERRAGDTSWFGLEEYIADCVVRLDYRIHDEISTRRLRVIKYRGSPHGGNEYPFLITSDGLSVLPISSAHLDHRAPTERLSSGIDALDQMLGGQGYYRGSSILVSGSAGTGKSSLAASFADAACRRGEQVLYNAFEESPAQIIRNMQAIGIDLARWQNQGLLEIQAQRPTLLGIEEHLLTLRRLQQRLNPQVIIIDPISSLIPIGTISQIRSMLARLIDYFKQQETTAMFINLAHSQEGFSETDVGVSSLMDVWIGLIQTLQERQRQRKLSIIKARGVPCSDELRSLQFSSQGIQLRPIQTSTTANVDQPCA